MMSLADDVAVQGAHGRDPGPRDTVLGGRRRRPLHCPWNAYLMSRSHDRQSMPSSAPEVNQPGELTIGELARRTGVAASALRYYEELGLLPAPPRISGQRRYPESAVTIVAAIRLQSDAGFTLAEQKALIAPGDGAADWRELAQRKLAELDERIARAQAARDAISHGLRCPRRAATQRPDFQAVCPDFQARVATGRTAGRPR
jgi:MerR family redox-sensitive transcriptional activator SoxR